MQEVPKVFVILDRECSSELETEFWMFWYSLLRFLSISASHSVYKRAFLNYAHQEGRRYCERPDFFSILIFVCVCGVRVFTPSADLAYSCRLRIEKYKLHREMFWVPANTVNCLRGLGLCVNLLSSRSSRKSGLEAANNSWYQSEWNAKKMCCEIIQGMAWSVLTGEIKGGLVEAGIWAGTCYHRLCTWLEGGADVSICYNLYLALDMKFPQVCVKFWVNFLQQ